MTDNDTHTSGADRTGFFARLNPSRLSPRARTLLIGGAIAAVVLLALVVVPGILASQPSFYAGLETTQPEYETWATSVHAKVSCQSCHADPGALAQAGYSARMLGEFYLTKAAPSRGAVALARPTNEACSRCHIDLRSVSPSGDLNIPHRAHVEVLDLECVQCHEFLVHEVSPEGSHQPRMVACMECHDGEQADNSCTTCHTEKAAPDNHQTAEWVVVHPDMQDEVDCASCHAWTEDWCIECHDRRPTSHTDTWRADHGVQVEKRRNCEACHDADFCIECHGVVPRLNFDPDLKPVRQGS